VRIEEYDWYIQHNDFSPESDEASPLSVVPGNEDEPRQESQYDLSPVSDIDHDAPPTPEYANEEQYLLAHPELTEGVQRLSAFGTLYTPVSGDEQEQEEKQEQEEQAPYVPRLRIIDSGSEAEPSNSASDDSEEEEEEMMEVPPPPSLSAHQRDVRAA
jgi:hypothetical protein